MNRAALAIAGLGCEVDGCEVDGAWRCCDLCECRARLLASGLLPTAPTTTVTATAPTNSLAASAI